MEEVKNDSKANNTRTEKQSQSSTRKTVKGNVNPLMRSSFSAPGAAEALQKNVRKKCVDMDRVH